MVTLREYQNLAISDIYAAWERVRNVCLTLPTGAGKTVVFSHILRNHRGRSVAIAHRRELIGQIAMALARNNVPHAILAPSDVIREICMLQIQEIGGHLYNPAAHCIVASVDTLSEKHEHILRACSLWVVDECHHVLRSNKWGKVLGMTRNAKGLGVTATPYRADGNGLGANADGVFHELVVGPNARDLIDAGYLTDYKIVSSPMHADFSNVKIGKNGDYIQKQLREVARKSPQIVGDIVESYLKFAPGKRGVTFVTDVETAYDVAHQYTASGVPAAAIHAKTPGKERYQAIKKLRSGELLQLVNVDIFGEGFDLPAIEVVSMARATQSYGLYYQQFGRVLRLLEEKLYGLIIDHVGNVYFHGLIDYGRSWSLGRRENRTTTKDPNELPTRVCVKCSAVYVRFKIACPYCGHEHTPSQRSKPEFVDGDLTLLDDQAIMALRSRIREIDAPVEDLKMRMRLAGAPQSAVFGAASQHLKRQLAQQILRDMTNAWKNARTQRGAQEREAYMEFYHKFGVDIMTAETLGRPEAEMLTLKVAGEILHDKISN